MKRLRSLFDRSGPSLARLMLLFILFAWGFLTGPLPQYSHLNIEGNLLGLVVAGSLAFVFYMITLWLAGPHVLPAHPRNKYEKKAARDLLLRFGLRGRVAMAVVREAHVLPGPNGESREGLTGLGVIDMDSTTAVVLLTDTGQSRIKEPGLIFTRENERLGALVDLRVQLRTKEDEYLTRDGIPVRVSIAVRFQIDQTHFNRVQEDTLAHPLPAPVVTSQHAIRRAIGTQSVQDSGEAGKWHDVPLGLAQGMLRAMLADYKFDDLLQPQEPTANPRAVIRAELEEHVRAVLAQHGIRLLSLGLGVFFPTDYDPNAAELGKNTITRQRVDAWKVEWESRMLKVMAQAHATADRQHDLARTQAQMELITRVTQALEQGGPMADKDQDQIARRFLSTLQRMADEQMTRERLGEENLGMLNILMRDRAASDMMPDEPPTES